MKLTSLKIIFAGLSLCSVVSCSKDSKSEVRNESIGYHFIVNGCDTGEKSFNDKTSYCSGLLNEAANNYCARSIREETYIKECGSLPASTHSYDSYKYHITADGCDTGEKSFNDKTSYCSGLLNEAANNYCARTTREEMYRADCSN